MAKRKKAAVAESRDKSNFYKDIICHLLQIRLAGSGLSFTDRQIIDDYFLQGKAIEEIARENDFTKEKIKALVHQVKLKIMSLLGASIRAAKENVSLIKERDLLRSKVLALEEENRKLRLQLDKKLIKKEKFEVPKNMTIQGLYERGLLTERNRNILGAHDLQTVEALKRANQKTLLRYVGFGKVGLRQVEKIIGYPLPKE